MPDAGTAQIGAEQAAQLPGGTALLSADDFAAALAEIESAGPLSGKPQQPSKPGSSSVVDAATNRPADEIAKPVDALPVAAPVAAASAPEAPPSVPSAAPVVEPPADVPETQRPPEVALSPATAPAVTAAGDVEPAQLANAAPAAPPPNPAAPGLKFKIGKKGGGVPVGAGLTAGGAAARAASIDALGLPTLSPTVRLGKRFIRWVEGVLDAVHRPLEQFSPRLLPILGLCALTTIGVSAASIVLLPILFPSRDAIAFLDERVAALDAPKVEKPKPAASEHKAEKAAEDADDAHGETKPRKRSATETHGDAKPTKKNSGDGHGAAAKTETKTAPKPGGAKKSVGH